MNKSNFFTGQPVFAQVLNLIDKGSVKAIAKEHQSDRYYKKFKTLDHLICMLYAAFTNCQSLRDLAIGMCACEGKLTHLGVTYCPKKSTISDANKNRNSIVFGEIYYSLYRRYQSVLPDSRIKVKDKYKVQIVDSSTIRLFKEILKTGGKKSKTGRQKGGVKAHTVLRSDMSAPQFIRYTAANTHDKHFLKDIPLQPGDFICMDRAYWHYKQFSEWTNKGVCFITRMKKDCKYIIEVIIPPTDAEKEYGVRNIEIVTIPSSSKPKKAIERTSLKRVTMYDEVSKREFVFVSNGKSLAAIDICEIYKSRWRIEKLFKKLKQNFPLKYFLGDNVNAIEIQIWTNLIAMLLLSIFQNQTKRKWAFSNIASLVSVHLMAYVNFYKFLANPQSAWQTAVNRSTQVDLFSSA